ncbi:hypothetical protein HWV62_4453 [Athelia sp. TMB]|nr:hypothetical protein HWV62_4453 [Athelia sp. TMB]
MTSTQAKPANKGLSTGTLSLKFMQNAHRAKQLAQVELEQAEVKDEAEWQVSKEVREAWGVASGSGSQAKATDVVYEASYIPFLFDREDDGDVEKPRGRRVFGKHGKEVEEVTVSMPEPQAADPDNQRRLTSISGSGSSSASPTKSKPRDTKKPSPLQRDLGKSAQNVIRDISGVGTDLRGGTRTVPNINVAPPKPIPAQPAAFEGAFMKPTGVDLPKVPSADSVLQGARAKPKSSAKRQRESDADAAAGPTVEGQKEKEIKKKKKKKVSE